MPLDGSGTYNPVAPEFPAIPNTLIKSADFNQIILDIAAALSMAIFRDGQAPFTADQSMGGNKLLSLEAGAAPTDAVNFLQVFTDPSFTATTVNGVQINGTAAKFQVTTLLLAASTLTATASMLLDMSASTEVKLPANTSIGPVSAAELAVLNGLLATTAELNKLAGALITTAELNNLHGVTSSTAELNVLDGMLATTAELNILAGATVTTAELNVLDGLIVSTAKLNSLDTVTIAEIQTLSGVTSSIQTQLNGKAGTDSPVFTGIPQAPTAPAFTSTTQLATTEFVIGQSMLAGVIPPFLLFDVGII